MSSERDKALRQAARQRKLAERDALGLPNSPATWDAARKKKVAARGSRVVANIPADLIRLRLGMPLGRPPALEPIEMVSLQSSLGPFQAHRVVTDGMVFFAPDLSDLTTRLPDEEKGDQYKLRLTEKRAWPSLAVANVLALTHGRVMLDVGANIGLTSIPRALLELFEHVHAFEPEPRNFASLEAGIAGNGLSGRMTAWNTAVGEQGGTIDLALSAGIARHRALLIHDERIPAVTVPITTLDEWAVKAGIDPRDVPFIKVDAQGFEPHILKGARSFLSVPDVAWQLEVHLPLMAAGGTPVGNFRTQIETRFKAFLDLREMGAGLRPVSEIGDVLAGLEQSSSYTDIVAITKGD
jgi:FkbM family methyltransferase